MIKTALAQDRADSCPRHGEIQSWQGNEGRSFKADTAANKKRRSEIIRVPLRET